MKKIVCLLAALAASFSLCGEIVLAKDGKSDYRIVPPETLNKLDAPALEDLAKYLKQITGADFTGKEAKHAIYVGKSAPSDKTPLQPHERRVRSENGDIYIYGEGAFGSAFAVYDFLDKFFGCRWYTVRGRERIPANPNPCFEILEYAHVPSFSPPNFYGGTWFIPRGMLVDYARRNRIFVPGSNWRTRLGPGYGHVPCQLIPPGRAYHFVFKPYKYYTNEEWFETHPEYFSMNASGKRVPYLQLCYSNPEVRKLFDAKIEEIIAKEYKGGAANIRCDLNDNNGVDGKTICCCPECMKLVEKYNSPGGPYWDYVFDLCRRFKVKYPEITFGTSAYLPTETPPRLDGMKMPDNLTVGFAPLNKNFLKSYDHPTNQWVYDLIKAWGKVCPNIGVQLYPAVYPRATTILPLVANLRQLVRNVRICHKLNIRRVYGEQGYIWGNVNAFNELRQYLLARITDDVNIDETAVVEEFMRDIYGKAAPLMIAYWKELEEYEVKEEVGLTWFGLNYGTFSYLTGENLARWSRDFDKMEALVADDPVTLRDVRDARFNLDEALLSVHNRLPQTPEFDRTRIYERAKRTFDAGLEPFIAAMTPEERQSDRIEQIHTRRLANGLDYFYAASKTPGPLPEGIEKKYPGPIYRVLPDRRIYSGNGNVRHLTPEPESAFGIALKSNRGKMSKTVYVRTLRVYDPSGKAFNVFLNDAEVIRPSAVRKHKGKYKLHFCGRTRLYPQSLIQLGVLDKLGRALVGQCWDPKNPNAEYDVYVSLKLDKNGDFWISEVVLCGTGRDCPEQKSADVAANG